MKKQIMAHCKEVTLNADCSFDQSAVRVGEDRLKIFQKYLKKIEWNGNGSYGEDGINTEEMLKFIPGSWYDLLRKETLDEN